MAFRNIALLSTPFGFLLRCSPAFLLVLVLHEMDRKQVMAMLNKETRNDPLSTTSNSNNNRIRFLQAGSSSRNRTIRPAAVRLKPAPGFSLLKIIEKKERQRISRRDRMASSPKSAAAVCLFSMLSTGQFGIEGICQSTGFELE